MADNPEKPSDWMESAFTTAGSASSECDCGRIHFSDDHRSFDWGPGELERLRKRAEEMPNKYIGGGALIAEINGHHYIVGCPCNGLRRYEDFIWESRHRIARYLSARVADTKRATDFDAALMGDLPLKVSA